MKSCCPFCKIPSDLFFTTKDYNRKIDKNIFNYFKCKPCKLVFLSPIPDSLENYYPPDYHLLKTKLEEVELAARHERFKVELIKRYIPHGRLLEIGPSRGDFLFHARKAGFDVEGIEMDEKCCSFIEHTLNIPVTNSSDTLSALNKAGSYDVITLWHVIEHLPDPWTVLEAISRHLNPGGILALAAPNPQSLQFKLMGRFWAHLDAPRHLELIPSSLLIKKAESMGFKTLLSTTKDVLRQNCNGFGWLNSFGHYLSPTFGKGLPFKIRLVMNKLLKPVEACEGLGSAYTLVFQKQ